jgi:enamine deaminase RidA (YjgF/YER057c/UK114 family)
MKLAVAFGFLTLANVGSTLSLELRRINPEGLSKPQGYSQVVVAENVTRWILLPGQGGIGPDGRVPEDLGEQTRLMFEKIRIGLAAAGAAPRDVVRITVYIVDLEKIDPTPVYQGIREFFPADAKPASTVVGVSALALRGMKVEIDVTAVARAQ